MPLLKKKPFQKATLPEHLRDEDEVFFCAVTNEIFRDYEEFSERMFLCNSMVWTCALTGKNNLTYAEAVESEESARKSLKDFPKELRVPSLYLASKTKRTAFGDMAEDVFMYMKDRYFIGESVETSFTGTKWKDSHVLHVLAPPPKQIKGSPKNGNIEDHHSHIPSSLYKYEIEHLDADDEDISEIMIVDCNHIRRKKGLFSRERCRIFLRQYVEQDERGVFVMKKSANDTFKIDEIKFEQIFDGPLPSFDASKKFEKAINGKKTRQESLHKFLTKGNPAVKTHNTNLLERMRQREEEFNLKKQKHKEEKQALKRKQKEENVLCAGLLKNWYKPKEDLELNDQKKLCLGFPVKSKVPEDCYGDMLMLLEFVNSFSKLLSAKDFFPSGLTIEIIERALTENEVAGPLTDLIQMFLTALFNAQDEEASQYKTETENPLYFTQEDTSSENMNLREATRLATSASKWSNEYQGVPLARLPLYSITTSEILRLHLLSSGAVIKSLGARWRYQQRGGYTSVDDPGLHLRLNSPHILKTLRIKNVVELAIPEKVEILSCLVNQLLTYADVRDVVEERMEKVKQAKLDFKSTVAAERRREQKFLTARSQLKKSKGDDPKFTLELRKLENEAEIQKADNQYKLKECSKVFHEQQVVLGYDRAYRQYLKLDSVPGLFVTSEEKNKGRCLDNVVKQHSELVNASEEEILLYIRKTCNEANTSSKEKSPKRSNGIHNGLVDESLESVDSCHELLMCSGEAENCIVHSSEGANKWWFYGDGQFDELVNSLNKRGFRENELQNNLEGNRKSIEYLTCSTPATYLNSEVPHKEDTTKSKKTSKAKYENANLGYPADMAPADILHNSLVENLLEIEEKIFAGSLGRLFIKDREKWRNSLQNKNYQELDKTVLREYEKEETAEAAVRAKPPKNGISLIPDVDNNDVLSTHTEDIQNAIQCLSLALVQIAQSVEPKYLKKPLGRVAVGKQKLKENLLVNWVKTLMVSTSFSQVFLHYSTLDSCIMWGKSALLARCRICRSKTDSENMLLCDSCNWGHHLYCLRPKLKAVPPGDWYCIKCQREKKLENGAPPEPTPRKRRLFIEEEVDEEESEEEEEDSNEDDEEVEEEEMEAEEDELEKIPIKIDICKTCGSGGELLVCDKCSTTYHIECVEPPLRRAPRGAWLCPHCKKNTERRTHDKNYINGVVVQRTGVMNGQRRCAAKALFKIHDVAKSLRRVSESDDSSEEEVISKRYSRREEGRTDLPLHNAALQDVLSEVMKDNNAWPFLRPVQKNEVPDYYDVITKPMDFGTIKYKLNMGKYQEDAQFMSDALLVFQNCSTYNSSEDDVYKCGVELLKHFQKKCRELGLKLPDEIDYYESTTRPKKRIRTE